MTVLGSGPVTVEVLFVQLQHHVGCRPWHARLSYFDQRKLRTLATVKSFRCSRSRCLEASCCWSSSTQSGERDQGLRKLDGFLFGARALGSVTFAIVLGEQAAERGGSCCSSRGCRVHLSGRASNVQFRCSTFVTSNGPRLPRPASSPSGRTSEPSAIFSWSLSPWWVAVSLLSLALFLQWLVAGYGFAWFFFDDVLSCWGRPPSLLSAGRKV